MRYWSYIFGTAYCIILLHAACCKGFKEPETQLNAVNYACILAEESTDSDLVAKICDISPTLLEIVRQVIAGKQMSMQMEDAGQGGDAVIR